MKARFKSNVLAAVLLFLCTHLTFFPAWGWARAFVIGASSVTAPSSTALPSGGAFTNGSGSISSDETAHYLQVNQESDKAIVAWNTFDIGSASTVYFKNGTAGTTLNRIGSSNASKIFGTLNADGNVYLVNTNGVLFGKTAKVNLRSLVASSLDITDDDYLNNNWNYKADGYTPGDVANYGDLTSTSAGRIMLVGGNVENGGTISADGGEVLLGAATEFEVTEGETAQAKTENNVVVSDYSGTAVNNKDGRIYADVGEIGIYGKMIRHEGKIRALSTVQRGSRIELVAATDNQDASQQKLATITTGAESEIDLSIMEGDEVATDTPFNGRSFKISTITSSKNISDSATDSLQLSSPINVRLNGTIKYPSGDLTVNAGDGGIINIGSGAVVDLSGSLQVRDAIDQVFSAQLNSEELRDEQIQAGGFLQGKTIFALLREGAGVGNLSSHLENLTLTPKEQSATGGRLSLMAGSGTVIINQGARIDVSGGGTEYLPGYIQTTVLVSSDGDEYDISQAPGYIEYVDIINPDNDGQPNNIDYAYYMPGYMVGADAGSVDIQGGQVVFEGALSAGTTIGRYQVNSSELIDDLGYIKTAQTTIPDAGTLTIGYDDQYGPFYQRDPLVQKIVIMDSTPSLAADPDRNKETWLSDDLLSNSGLGHVYLYAVESITIQENTTISLVPGGSFSARARRIIHNGDISVHAGTVNFELAGNLTSRYLQGLELNPDFIDVGPERIELLDGSLIDVSGEKVFENQDENRDRVVLTRGGNISIKDNTVDGEGVVVLSGAGLNMDGGYHLSENAALLDAGNAGSLTIKGAAIILDGTVTGKSMESKNGGKVSLSALSVKIVNGGHGAPVSGYAFHSKLPDSLAGKLILEENTFDASGISNLSIFSGYDLVVQQGVTLAPSLIKTAVAGRGEIIEVNRNLQDIGDSSISLAAGVSDFGNYLLKDSAKNLNGTLYTEKGVSVTVAPGGNIALNGQGVDISGTFTALAGTISIDALKNTLALHINGDARFNAMGYNRNTGELLYDTELLGNENGGKISFSSQGTLVMESGAEANVSGSTPITLYKSGNRYGELTAYIGAGEPGSIRLTYEVQENDMGQTRIDGDFLGKKYLASLRGAQFSIENRGEIILDSFLESLGGNGFDRLVLKSGTSVDFTRSKTINMARKLLIDAPVISIKADNDIVLNSPWIQIKNTYYPDSTDHLDFFDAELTFNADFIDISGDVITDGFSHVRLNAGSDIRLSDTYYTPEAMTATWGGSFSTSGDLTLVSARTYTTTDAWFTLHADGDIFTERSGTVRLDPIYSAMGRLTVDGRNIFHNGRLAAPNGQIILSANGENAGDDILDGRVYLGSGSELSVAGSSVAVNYGIVDETNLKWTGNWSNKAEDKSIYGDIITTDLPGKSVDINGLEVIARAGSKINLDGNGVVFGYTVMPGLQGSYDPLEMADTFVIIPNVLGDLPGEAVYLEGNDVISAGYYTIVPDSYAFLGGALIVERIEEADLLNPVLESVEGYSVVVGHDADSNGSYASQSALYTVRSGAQVLSETDFQIKSLTTGNAGKLSIDSPTTVFNASVTSQAVNSGFSAGSISLSGTDVILSASSKFLGNGFSDKSQLDSSLIDQLYVNATSLSQGNFEKINLGSESTTKSITLEDGAMLSAEQVNLVSQKDISLKSGSVIQGRGDNADVTITSTQGNLALNEGAYVTSDNALSVNVQGLTGPQNLVAGTSISLASDTIYLLDDAAYKSLVTNAPEAYRPSGMILRQALWSSWGALENIELIGNTEFSTAGTVSLAAPNAFFSIDTPDIIAVSNDTNLILNVKRAKIYNSRDTIQDEDPIPVVTEGRFTVNADTVYVGNGNVDTLGFSNVSLNASQSLAFLGSGSLTTNNGDLLVTADVVTGSYVWNAVAEDGQGTTYEYEALDFYVDAGNGQIKLADNSVSDTWEANDNNGGRLFLAARRIENATSINLNSGRVYMDAQGTGDTDGIYMKKGAQILVKGSNGTYESNGGGGVVYKSASTISLAGSLTDVSGNEYGDGGIIYVINPDGGLTLSNLEEGDAVFQGLSSSGDGGTFLMDTKAMADISPLGSTLSHGGFTKQIGLRMREGDVTLDEDDIFQAHEFKLSVDQGSITVNGAIDASGAEQGGTIELYAGKNLTLDGATLFARGTGSGSDGGKVTLAAGVVETDKGYLAIENSIINLSADDDGTDGMIYARVAINDANTDLEMRMANNKLSGISKMIIGSVARYKDSYITNTDLSTNRDWYKKSNAFMDNEANIKKRLEDQDGDGISDIAICIVPEVEIYNDAMIRVSDLDLSSWRFGDNNIAGVLTIKAAGDLQIRGNIQDAVTPIGDWNGPDYTYQYLLNSNNIADSTTINLVAGATLSSSDIFAVDTSAQNPATLTINSGKYIYSESGDINFASAGDTLINDAPTATVSSNNHMNSNEMSYNIGTYAGIIKGYTGNDLIISSGVIQTATGNINLDVGNDLLLETANNNSNLGTIRTVGEVPSIEETGYYWMEDESYMVFSKYKNGGSIAINTGGDITMESLNSDAWYTSTTYYDITWEDDNHWTYTSWSDVDYAWAASYGKNDYNSGHKATQGIAAMAGGDVSIDAGGSVFLQAGTFGTGELTVEASGDINGRYLNKGGSLVLESLANIGNLVEGQVVEAFDTRIDLRAQGNITLAGIVNPTIAHSEFDQNGVWNLTYNEANTAATLITEQGDITLGGNPGNSFGMSNTGRINIHLLPGTLNLFAARDIALEGNLYLAPSATGNLTLVSGNDITGENLGGSNNWTIFMSDTDPELMYGTHGTATGWNPQGLDGNWNGDGIRSWELVNSIPTGIVHENDKTSVFIKAGNDLVDISLNLPKSATVIAGRDIGNLTYTGQNLRTDDVTSMTAGRDIYYDVKTGTGPSESKMGITIAGPGLSIIQAGNNISLGHSKGIQSVGSTGEILPEGGTGAPVNSYLPEGDNHLMVVAGVGRHLTKPEMDGFFNSLRQAAIDYSAAINDGNDDLADGILAQIRDDYIDPIVDNNGTGEGNISLVNSTIYTSGGAGDILAFATGQIDVGLSSVKTPPILGEFESTNKTSGIFTKGGGDIKIFASGDINVNQSRIMTFNSGDIDIWSDHGNINAGMGSTVAYASSDTYTVLNYDGTRSLKYNPPATGSGIRATATSTDELGDVYVTAPDGIIDAGEAGIAGNNVTLAALEVLNVQNISVTGVATGFTPASDASASVSGLSGSGSVADNSMMNEQAAALAGEKEDEDDDKKSYSVEPKWVSVEVTEFEDNDQGDA
nr:filamentous haemagglutinin family protein [uncultured Desulfobacter sp.]